MITPLIGKGTSRRGKFWTPPILYMLAVCSNLAVGYLVQGNIAVVEVVLSNEPILVDGTVLYSVVGSIVYFKLVVMYDFETV